MFLSWSLNFLVTSFSVILWGHLVASDCHFPRNWWGNWYQSGLGDVFITGTHISHKGYCHDHQRDYYLVENRNEGCQTCLLVISRHPNILQYKESYCIGPETIHSLCSKIRIEAVLYTLVRENSTPIPCPFQNAFHFIYNNNSGGFCRHPMSYVHQCVTPTKFNFRFRRCENSAYTYDKDMELECLATWKDGSEVFVYGSLTSDTIRSKEDKYRCFMYSILGTVVYLAMSADATCRGLRTSKDGPLIMELTEDLYGWPTPQCHFPAWITDTSWRDLSGKHRYYMEDNAASDSQPGSKSGNTITMAYQSKGPGADHALAAYKCLSLHHGNETGSEGGGGGVMILTQVIEGCLPRYQCLRFQRRHYFQVLEIQKGVYVDGPRHRCSQLDFPHAQQSQLLLSTEYRGGSCLFEGRYQSPVEKSGCQLEVMAGCTDKARLDIVSSCQTRPVLQLKCIVWWRENDNSFFFLAQDVDGDKSNRITCYMVIQLGQMIELQQDRSCNSQQREQLNMTGSHNDRYLFKDYLDECPSDPHEPEVVGFHGIDKKSELVAENSYSHVIGEEHKSNSDTFSIIISRNMSTRSSCVHFSNLLLLTLLLLLIVTR